MRELCLQSRDLRTLQLTHPLQKQYHIYSKGDIISLSMEAISFFASSSKVYIFNAESQETVDLVFRLQQRLGSSDASELVHSHVGIIAVDEAIRMISIMYKSKIHELSKGLSILLDRYNKCASAKDWVDVKAS